jgi:hypothetical protein
MKKNAGLTPGIFLPWSAASLARPKGVATATFGALLSRRRRSKSALSFSPPRLQAYGAAGLRRAGDRASLRSGGSTAVSVVPRPVSIHPRISDPPERALMRTEGHMMIKNGHLSAVFLPRKSQPVVRICQATTLILLALLFRISWHSQTYNPPAGGRDNLGGAGTEDSEILSFSAPAFAKPSARQALLKK